MTFREAVLESLGNGDAKAQKLASRMDGTKAPLLWKALEKVVQHRYEEATGKKVGDWASIINWLSNNLPDLIKLILAIFGKV